MRWRSWIALLTIVGAAVGIAFYAWPASATMPEPHAVDMDAPRQLPVSGTLRGDYQAHDLDLARLIPPASRINGVWYAPARRHHQQVLVRWTYLHKYAWWTKMDRMPRWGMTLWSFTGARWQAVKIPVVQGPVDLRIAFADVTGDERADLLFEQAPGTNHGCGPHEVFSTSPHGVTQQVFSSYMCETTLRADHGLLALDLPYYIRNDSMCCWSYTEYLRLRWDGRTFVQASVRMQKNTFPWG